jgi:hypothetical protein
MTAVVQLDDLRVPVEVGGSSRKARLTIEADGSLRLRAAEDVAIEELQQFLASKREWLYRKLAEKEFLQYEPITKELVDGEGFFYLGRSHRLKIDDVEGAVRLERGRLILPRRLVEIGEVSLMAWYQRCGEAWLRPRSRAWAERLRVDAGLIEVADLGRKWGSATTGGRVRIHWATLQLSPPLVDYVLVHELTHLHEPHHGPAFWQLLARIMPEYEERKQELAIRGSRLWFGNTSLLSAPHAAARRVRDAVGQRVELGQGLRLVRCGEVQVLPFLSGCQLPLSQFFSGSLHRGLIALTPVGWRYCRDRQAEVAGVLVHHLLAVHGRSVGIERAVCLEYGGFLDGKQGQQLGR